MEQFEVGQYSAECDGHSTEYQLFYGEFCAVLFGEEQRDAKQGKDGNGKQSIAEGGGDIGCFAPIVYDYVVKHKKSSFDCARRDNIENSEQFTCSESYAFLRRYYPVQV